MFCDRCGAEVQAGQRFCGGCGRQMGVSVMPAAAEGRVARHSQILAILWFVASALNLLVAGVCLLLGHTLFGGFFRIPEAPWVPNFLHGLFGLLGILIFLKALAGFAAAWGLLERESWARPLMLVLGFISLLHIPFGTALGIYTIWVLLSPGAEEEYRRLARAA